MAFSYVAPGNAEYVGIFQTGIQPSVLYNSVELVERQLGLPTINTLQNYAGKLPNIALTNAIVSLSGATYEAMLTPGFIGVDLANAVAGAGLGFGDDTLQNANYIKGLFNLSYNKPAVMFAVQNNSMAAAPANVILANNSGTNNYVQFTNGGQSASGQAILFPNGSTAQNAYVIVSLANTGVDALDGTYVAQNVVNFNVVSP